MTLLHLPSPVAGKERALLVMLPGLKMKARNFVDDGLIAALHARSLPIDAVAVDADSTAYLDGAIVETVHSGVIGPACDKGYRRIMLLGVSLGAMGALFTARAHGDALDGLILLAPYLGTTGTILGVERAGGLVHWEPGPLPPGDIERRLLLWLRGFVTEPTRRAWVRLGYGTEDRFRAGAQLLVPLLPKEDVVVVAGPHESQTFTHLFAAILDSAPFAAPATFASWLQNSDMT